ncbi:hypothetical protein K6L44_16680 [Gluconacetobacter entanii]|uniref:hypothetical protein n=1 Tax=Gluconacetobacter entanii TaxID=108528 RepID=UPI001C932865|nr:hypothetical protein [Gluconacetobacter entanii]MBY4641588.1 hypothetical protein [Gluconacetobacter entanii]MCW4582013.1 hypothetical protein [Gluconacetobacter entanii]MCW4585245.1 hypothetical protein [Gluconacetobacter entanii]MCW4588822.1 hypothetical protein [Gluconacetobacter entanii]
MATWGNWQLNLKNACLEHPGPGVQPYQIYLGDITSSASILNWIYQMKEKTWMTSDDVSDLVKAFYDIFGRGVCGDGVSHSFNPENILSAKYGIDFSA